MAEQYEVYPVSPWGTPVITRADALKLMNVTEQELDQLGMPCRFIQIQSGVVELVYKPEVFVEIMTRMRQEIASMTRAISSLTIKAPTGEPDFTTVH